MREVKHQPEQQNPVVEVPGTQARTNKPAQHGTTSIGSPRLPRAYAIAITGGIVLLVFVIIFAGILSTNHQPSQVGRRLGLHGSTGALMRINDAQLNPARYVLGVRTAAATRGVSFYDGTVVTSITPSMQGYLVQGEGFRLEADKVVVGAGLATARLVEEVRTCLVPTPGQLVFVETKGQRPAGPGFAERGEFYWRNWRNGLIVGGMGSAGRATTSTEVPAIDGRVQAALESLLRGFFRLTAFEVKARWTGNMDYSIDGLPLVGEFEPHPGLIVACGFTGLGFGYIPAAAETIGRMILGEEVAVPPWIAPGRPLRAPPDPIA